MTWRPTRWITRRCRRSSPTLPWWASLTYRGWREAGQSALRSTAALHASVFPARFFAGVTERANRPSRQPLIPMLQRPRERKRSPYGSSGRRWRVCPHGLLAVLPMLEIANDFDSPIAKYQRKQALSTQFLTIDIINDGIYYVIMIYHTPNTTETTYGSQRA